MPASTVLSNPHEPAVIRMPPAAAQAFAMAPEPAAKTALDLVREANEEGYGERDMSAVAEFLRGRAG